MLYHYNNVHPFFRVCHVSLLLCRARSPSWFLSQLIRSAKEPLLTLVMKSLHNEPPHGKTNNLHRRKQRRRSASRLLISAFVFATRIVRSLFFLNTKFHTSSCFQSLHRPVCVVNHIVGFPTRRLIYSQSLSAAIKI